MKNYGINYHNNQKIKVLSVKTSKCLGTTDILTKQSASSWYKRLDFAIDVLGAASLGVGSFFLMGAKQAKTNRYKRPREKPQRNYSKW